MYQEVLALRSELQRVAELMQGYMQRERQLHDAWHRERDDSSSSSESDPGVRMKGRAALRRAVKERKAIEEMRRESMHGKLMQVLTSFWTRDQHPDWSVAAKDILRKHVDQIQDTCREAKRLKHTCEALVLLCAEDYQTRLKNKVDDVQKKQMWDDYKARALLQVPQQPRIVPYTGYDPKTAQTPRQRKVVKLPKSGERNQPPFTSSPLDQALIPLFRAFSTSAATLRHLSLQGVAMGPAAQQMLAELCLGRCDCAVNWTSHRFFPRIHKTAQLLHQWRLATDDPETQTTILEVLGKDFVVSSALLREMCALQPDQLPAVLNKLMHCVNGGISHLNTLDRQEEIHLAFVAFVSKDVDEFQKFLKSLARRNSLDTKLRLQVLRSVGWLLYLKAYQLRLLLGIFEDEFRSICAASLLFRVVDMQNEKIFRCAFDATQFSLLQKSVGYLACFPYIQPEQWTVDLDLTQYDQRRVVQCLWTLAEKERMDNLTQIVYLSAEKVQLNNADWVPPISWCSVENVPTSGHMKVTYRGGKDIMSWPTRKKLYET
eukprot:g20645.t1